MLKDNTKKIINDLYMEILFRLPDEDGLKYHGMLLESGRFTIDDIRFELLNSEESKASLYRRNNVLSSFKSKYSESEIKKIIDSNNHAYDGATKSGFYHSFQFNDVFTNDARSTMNFQAFISQGIPSDLTGKSVLDIGTADGFYSFLCEQRGAKRVVAFDFIEFPGFKIAKKILDSNVEFFNMNTLSENLPKGTVSNSVYLVNALRELNETFDIVLLYGVYYHLDNPYLALQEIASTCNDMLLLSGHIADSEDPLMYFYDEYEIHNADSGNWWTASPSCLLNMAKRVGFKNNEMLDSLNVDNHDAPISNQNSERKVNKQATFKFLK